MPLDAHPSHPATEPSRDRRRPSSLWVPALGLVALGVACKIDPKQPVIHYRLSADTTAVGEDGFPVVPASVQDQIAGSLGMLFGSPQNPRFLRTSEWVDDDYDPNYPQYPEDDLGGGELSDEELDRIAEENRVRFRRQLQAIEEGRYEDVRVPAELFDLAENVAYDLSTPEEEREADFDEYLADRFVNYYPSLRESAEMYRQQCLHCHGPEGGGNGPTADFLNPRPRDYRQGIFKFTALKDKSVPRRADLYRIIEHGATGTAMPSFRRFTRAEIHGMVDYVRLLSMRGMVESDLVYTYLEEEALPAEYVVESYLDVWDKWQTADDKFVAYDGEIPKATPESIARGKLLFEDASKGNCASCHGVSGRGDGVAAWEVDPETQESVRISDDWGNPVIPRNFKLSLFRGGRRPIDIYRRIYSGINGTPMPALGETLDADGNRLVPDEDIWAIVHYVGALTEGWLPVKHYDDDHGHDGDDHGHEHGADGHSHDGDDHGHEGHDHDGDGHDDH